jgi:hypothetical protein
MAQTAWIRLNREQSQRVLNQLSAHKDAVVFSPDVTEVCWRPLPFYTDYRLYRLTNYATMPTFTLSYISNGDIYIALDGTANPIYTANDKDPVKLDETNVIPYLEFFFSHVQGSEGDVFLIKDPQRMPFMSTLSLAQQQSIIRSFKPIAVSADHAHHTCRVSGTLHYGGGLLAATIVVSHDGKILFQDQSLLLTGIHFPDSPYTPAWIEG